MKFHATLPSAWFRHAPATGPVRGGVRDFFRYHGVLAPGVRLLRALPFGAKAAVVSGAFLLPLALMCTDYVDRSLEKGHQINQAQAALGYSNHIHALLADVRDLRRTRFYVSRGRPPPAGVSLTSPAEAWAQVQAALQKLSQVDGLGQGLLPESAREDLHKTVQCVTDLQPEATGPEPTVMRETNCINRLRHLQAHVVQQSLMSALGEPALAQLQSLVILDLTDMEEVLITLRGRAVSVLQNRDAETPRRLMEARAVLLDSVLRKIQERLDSYGEGQVSLAAYREQPLWKEAEKMLRDAGLTESAADRVPNPAQLPGVISHLLPQVQDLHQRGLRDLQVHLDAAERELHHQRLVTGVSVSVLVILAVYLLLAFYRVMHGGLNQVRSQVARMASGDLSARPQPWSNDEVAQALSSLGASLARLADLFAAVRQGVSAVSHASRDIASGNHDLSKRTDRSAQAIQEILQGVTGYTAQLDECGQQIDRAVEVVESMRLDAARSRTRMSRLDERMQSLQGKSREIGEISELIDNIAFRTNILALNASVEAAKAGEAGRGFAVVAQEVRSLAQRSAESARRIADIIQRSTDDIEQGSALSQLASQSLADTDGHVQRIHETMQQIVALTREGQSSSQHILDEIRGLSEVTQENTRLVGQMEAASHALSTQGDHLSEKVASFKLN